jgi:Fe-S cluster assembly protein SufD
MSGELRGPSPAVEAALGAHPPFLAQGHHAALAPLHARGIERLRALDFPTIQDEAWRYTNLKAVANRAFLPSARGDHGWTAEALAERSPADLDGPRLVFVDGRFAPHLSATVGLPEGVLLGSLAEALAKHPARVTPFLGGILPSQGQPLVALNEAFLQDGAFLWVPRGVVVEAPIHLIFAASRGGREVMSCPRSLWVVDPHAQVTLVEQWVGDHGAHLTSSAAEIYVADGAAVQHTRIFSEGAEDVHVASSSVVLGRASNYQSRTWWLGGALVRNDQSIKHAGERSECRADGVYVVNGQRHVDTRTVVDHAVPLCNSNQLCKGILLDKGRGVFQGKVIVRQDAQKTNAYQSNPNLLLSPQATADTRPQLEIYADDVRCTHGAAVGGALDEDALFYLRARGVPAPLAKRLLTAAFAQELVEAEPLPAVRDFLTRALQHTLEA